MPDEKKTYTLSEELARELRQHVVKDMYRYNIGWGRYLCQYCGSTPDCNGSMSHKKDCLGQKLIEALK